MVKKVFAIIGIVTGSVLAFMGSFLGIMALMGKFTTPDVFPDSLAFVQDEGGNRIVASTDEFYSFVLSGTNANPEYAKYGVNKTTCYLWFADPIGAKLIELYDSSYNLLQKQNGKYKIDCNSPVYYKVKPLTDETKLLDGKVELIARHENDNVQSDKLIIWVDREIQNIYMQDGENIPTTTVDGILTQELTIPTNEKKYIDFVVNPDKSLKPISAESQKTIELYFDDKNDNFDDYILVNKDNISSNLSKILGYDEEQQKFYFYLQSESSLISQRFDFKIAVYPTYEARDFYSTVDYDTYYDKVQDMLTTNVNVGFVNPPVTQISLSNNASVVFNLYSESDYITLNGESGVENAKNNNLGLVMENAGSTIDRYNEVKFGKVNVEENFSINKPIFKSNKTEDVIDLNDIALNILDYQISYSSIVLEANAEEQWLVINKITETKDFDDTVDYYCSNGVAVAQIKYNDVTQEYDTIVSVRLLSAGVYANIYSYADGTFKQATVEEYSYEISREINTGKDKSWNIISKSIPAQNVKLYVGVFVANNNGLFMEENLFRSAPITINPLAANYELSNSSYTMNITYGVDGRADTKLFNEIVPNITGSYNAAVFVTKDADVVEVVKKNNVPLTIKVGEVDYYIVGSYDGTDFTNQIKISETATKSTEIYIMQLQNSYKQTSEALMKLLLAEENFDTSKIIKVYAGEKQVTITPKHVLNASALSVSYYYGDENATEFKLGYSVYEQTSTHKIVISSAIEGMLTNIYNFYKWNTEFGSYFKVQQEYSSNLIIEDVVLNADQIVINFTAESKLTNADTPIYIKLSGVFENETEFEFKPIYILSNAPLSGEIIFRYGAIEEEYVTLFNSTPVENAYPYINIVIDKVTFNKNIYLVASENNVINITGQSIFNTSLAKDGLYFQDKFYKVSHEGKITYSTTNNDIVTLSGEGELEFNPISQGSAILKVVIANTEAFIAVNVTTDDGYKFFVKSTEVANAGNTTAEMSSASGFKLSDFVAIEYLNQPTTLANAKLVLNDVVCTSYEEGEPKYNKSEDGTKHTFTVDEVDTLTIEQNKGDWVFTRDDSCKYVPITISFTLQTLVGNIKINLTISSNVSVVFNQEYWKTKTIYQNTTVEVYELNSNNTNSLLKITGDDLTVVTIKLVSTDNGSSYNISSSTYPFAQPAGNYSLSIYSGDTKIRDIHGFKILPNVIATRTEDAKFNSDIQKASITEYYSFKSFVTEGVTYGKGASYYDNDGNLNPTEQFTDYNNLSLDCNNVVDDNGNALIDFSKEEGEANKSVNVGWIKTVGNNGNKQCLLKLKYEGYTILQTNEIVENSYNAEIVKTELISLTEYEYKNIVKLYKQANDVSANLISIESANIANIVYGNNKFTIPAITQPYTADFVFTFKVDNDVNKELILTTALTVTPLKPEKTQDLTAKSESDFDLLDIFNTTSVNANIYSIQVVDVLNENYESIADELFTRYSFPSGYIAGVGNANCDVTFGAISGPEKTVKVKFEIKYKLADNSITEAFVFTENLLIKNKQTITLTYPYQDEILKFDSANFKFVDSQDGYNIVEESNNGLFTITNKAYEPVLIYSDVSTTINLTNDAHGYSRIGITGEGDKTPTITKVGYQNQLGFNNYFESEDLKITSTAEGIILTLPAADAKTNGYIVLKVATTTNNYDYYFIYVYSAGAYNAVKPIRSDKNLNANIYLPNSIDAQIANIMTNFETTFNKDYNSNTTMFVVSATSLGSAEGYVLDGVDRFNSIASISTSLSIKDTNKYSTIVIALVYKFGLQVYCYGTITLYLVPATNEGNIESAIGTENWAKAIDGIQNGEYVADIPLGVTTVDCPFGADYKIKGTESGNFEISEVTESKTFDVIYEKGGLVLKVTYTKLKTTVPESKVITDANIGAFNKDNGFTTTYALSNLLGGYTGTTNLEFTVNGEVSNLIKEDNGNLQFTLKETDYVATVKITYENLIDANNTVITRTFTFNVKAGVSVDRSSTDSDSGLSSDSRKVTDKHASDKLYTQTKGSYIQFNIEKDSNLQFTKYSVAGLIIYVSTDVDTITGLAVTFDETCAINDDVMIDTSNASIAITANEQCIDFVHMAKELDVTMTVKAGSTEYNVYLTIAQTYKTVKAIYQTENANHENVVGGGTAQLIEDLLMTKNTNEITEIGASNILNNYKLKIETLDGYVDFYDIGFTKDNNPNKFTYDLKYGSVATNLLSNKTKIAFATVDSNATSTLLISNNAGVSNVEYVFQILPKAETVNYLSPVINNYISFTAFKNDDLSLKQLKIGELTDELNNKSFYLTGVNVNGYKELKKEITQDLITYTITTYNNQSITINFDGNLVYATFDGQLNEGDQVVVTISVYGISGYIFKNLQLVFTKLTVTETYSADVDSSIYAGDSVNLVTKTTSSATEKVKFVLAKSDLADQVTFRLNKNKSYYRLSTTTYYIYQRDSLFSYTENKKTLTFNQVGENITSTLFFDLLYNGYQIKEVSYNLIVNRNLQLVVNGESLANNIDNNAPETNFYINQIDNNGFGYTYPVSTVWPVDITKPDNGWYDRFVLDLYTIRNQGAENAAESTLKQNDISKVKFSVDTKYDSIVSVDNTAAAKSITFLKDYNGDVVIHLNVPTNNGAYLVDWTIHVQGIANLEYKKDNEKDDPLVKRLTSGGSAFASNTQVNIINVAEAAENGVGLALSRGQGGKDEELNVNMTAKYVENVGISSKTNEEIYKLANAITIVESVVKQIDLNKFTISLPNVPISNPDLPKFYVVVYEISLTYLGYTTETFYVAYEVVNYAQVQVYGTNANVNMDTVAGNSNYLPLFSYSEVYTLADGTKATFRYNNKNLIVHYGSDEYSSSDNVRFEDAKGNYFKVENGKIAQYNGSTINKENVEKTTSLNNSVFNSVFDSQFNSIFDYGNYIASITTIRIEGGTTDTTFDYTLVYNADTDSYGINLGMPNGTATTEAYINNSLEARLVVLNGEVELNSVVKYSETTTNGFRLYTDNALKANTGNTILVSDIFLPTEISDYSYYNVPVLGVFSGSWTVNSNKTWVSGNPTTTKLEDSPCATITVAGEKDTTYTLYPVVYSANNDGSSKIYKLSQTFYVIKATNGKIVVRNYKHNNLEKTFFSVDFDDEQTSQTLDLTNAFNKYSMSGTTFDVAPATLSNSKIITKLNGSDAYLCDATSISINSDVLRAYKQANPYAVSYETATFVATVDGVSVEIDVSFALPMEVQLWAENSTATLKLEENKTIAGKAFADMRTVYVNTEDAKYVNDGYYDYSTGEITLNTTNINVLTKVGFTVTFADGETYSFVVVCKPSAK